MTKTTAAGSAASVTLGCNGLVSRGERADAAIADAAAVWFGGDARSAARVYDSHFAWARELTGAQREAHAAGAWVASDLLLLAALTEAS